MEDKKKLNVVFANNKVDQAVLDYLSSIYDIKIVENYTKLDKKTLPLVDLIIFTGGEDVHPAMYGENLGKYTHTNESRDILERKAFDFQRSFHNKIPKLGICRGAQMLTVLSGGRLIQHVLNHNNSRHLIELRNGNHLEIPSDHHQMMFPYYLNSDKYELLGWSERFMSNIYFNGNNENIELPKGFLEPEIVYYKNTNSFCIQAHPEWDINSSSSKYLLKQIDFYLFNKNKEENINQEEFIVVDSLPETVLEDMNHQDFYTKIQELKKSTIKKTEF